MEFNAEYLYCTKLTNNYSTEKFVNTYLVEYWIGQKIYAREPLIELPKSVSYERIISNQSFKLQLIGKSFVLDDRVRVRVGLRGLLGRVDQ